MLLELVIVEVVVEPFVTLDSLQSMQHISLAHHSSLAQYFCVGLVVFVTVRTNKVCITSDKQICSESNLFICVQRKLQMLLVLADPTLD